MKNADSPQRQIDSTKLWIDTIEDLQTILQQSS